MLFRSQSRQFRPLCPTAISAGFPSPALDFIDLRIDLNEALIRHPSATYYGRVKGESMRDAGIGDEDLIIIDRALAPVSGKIAVCYLDGEFTLKRLFEDTEGLWLLPANTKYRPIKLEEGRELMVWGIVTYVIKAC